MAGAQRVVALVVVAVTAYFGVVAAIVDADGDTIPVCSPSPPQPPSTTDSMTPASAAYLLFMFFYPSLL
ncbi:hypothetical protein D3C72_1294020 [compost metagenome]